MSRGRWPVGSGPRQSRAHVPGVVQRIARSYPARASHTGHGSTADSESDNPTPPTQHQPATRQYRVGHRETFSSRRTRAQASPSLLPARPLRRPPAITPGSPVTTTPFAHLLPPASTALCALGSSGCDRKPSTTAGISAGPSLCAHPG